LVCALLPLKVNDKIYDAIAENRISDLKALVKEGSDLNTPTTNGSSVFDAVMIFGNCECAEILFQNKIDVFRKNKDGQNIYDEVVKSKNAKMIALLKKYYK
jgi:ankyrin repeat protein